jgi:hypothetical protein
MGHQTAEPTKPNHRAPTLRKNRNADLVEANLLPPDATLIATVGGVTHVARIRDGNLEIDGQVYPTPSAASIAVRNVRSWNGWRDWHYEGQSLHFLRERIGTDGQTPSSD